MGRAPDLRSAPLHVFAGDAAEDEHPRVYSRDRGTHMKCILSGGTGFIGRGIVERLLRDHHYVAVWSRQPGLEKRSGVAAFTWDPLTGEPPLESVNAMDTVIHLAGEPVAQRWNAEVKRRIHDSRVY